jgi:hypothetical protein
MFIRQGVTFNSGFAIAQGPVPASLLLTNLVLYLDPNNSSSYPGSGLTVTDLSGAGHNASLSGGTGFPTFISNPVKSFQYTKTSDYSSGNKLYTDTNFLGNDMTLQAWIKTTEVGAGTLHYTLMYIMGAETSGAGNDWGFGVTDTGKLAFGAGPSDITFASSAVVNTGAWVNCAVTRTKSSGAIKLYINGYPDGSGTGNSGNSLTDATGIWIADGQDGPSYTMGGLISGVLAYTSALSDSQILNNFNATRSVYGI